LVGQAGQGPVLAGFDFAFTYPFCDRGVYFPGHPESPGDVRQLWAAVERICAAAPEFYGGPFYTDRSAPFAEYLCYQTYTGGKFDNRRLRVSERLCAKMGARPCCAFKCVGSDGVGAGSLAGMRMLHYLATRHADRFSVWPFEPANGGKSALLEIFPRLYFRLAGQDPRRWSVRSAVNQTLAFYDSHPLPGRTDLPTEDEVDAVVAAAALRRLAKDPGIWHPDEMDDQAAEFEGWIFGVARFR
jgi:hypothetical protein